MSSGSNVYSEVYAFLNLLGEEYINKLPKGMYELFATKRNRSYELHIDINKNITEQFKNEETLVIISALNLYFFSDEDERKRLAQIYTENDKKILNKSYSDILRENAMKYQNVEQVNTLEVIKKESILNRIIKKIKAIFKR